MTAAKTDSPRIARPPHAEETSSAGLTMTFWSPGRELLLDDWVQQGRWLGAMGRASGWWLGDWIRYGNARYGDKYAAAARATGYDVQSLMNMAYVAGRFDISRRRENLSFSHHAELAGLPVEDQELWLDRAEAGRMSVRSLRVGVRDVREHLAKRIAPREARTVSVPAAAEGLHQLPESTGGERPQPTGSSSSEMEGAPPGRHTQTVNASTAEARDREHDFVCPNCGHRVQMAETARDSDRPTARAGMLSARVD